MLNNTDQILELCGMAGIKGFDQNVFGIARLKQKRTIILLYVLMIPVKGQAQITGGFDIPYS